MAEKTGKREVVRMQVVIDKEYADRVAEVARLMGLSLSATSAMLIEKALNDHEWLIKHIAVPIRRGLDRMMGTDWRKSKGEPAE